MAACLGYLGWSALRDNVRSLIEAELGPDFFKQLTEIPTDDFSSCVMSVYDLLHAGGYFNEKSDYWDVIDFLGDLLMEGEASLLFLLGCVGVQGHFDLRNHCRLTELAVEAWGDVMNNDSANHSPSAQRLSEFYKEAGGLIVKMYLQRPDYPESDEEGMNGLADVFEAACIAGDPESAAIVVQQFANLSLPVKYSPERFSSIFEDCRQAMPRADVRERYSQILLQLSVTQPKGFHGSGVAAEPYIGACAFTDEHGIEHTSSSLLTLAVEICATEAITALIYRPDMTVEHVTEAIELDETIVDSAEMLTLLQAGKTHLRNEVEVRENALTYGLCFGKPPRSPSPDMGF